MKFYMAVVLALGLLVGCSHDQRSTTPEAFAGAKVNVEVAPGTPTTVVLTSPATSGEESPTEPSFVTMHEVRGMDGQVVLPAGAPVVGKVHRVPAPRLGRPGTLRVELVGAKALDGTFVPMVGSVEIKGTSRKGMVVGLTVGMFFVYPPWSFFHLMHRGREASASPGFVIQGKTSR